MRFCVFLDFKDQTLGPYDTYVFETSDLFTFCSGIEENQGEFSPFVGDVFLMVKVEVLAPGSKVATHHTN